MTFLENVDKAKLQKILLITISALMLIALALLLAIVIMSIEPAGLQGTDIEFTDYTLTDKDVATGSLVLADKDHPYTPREEWLELTGCTAYMEAQPDATGVGSEDFTEKNYIPWKKMRLNATAMAATHKMLTAAKDSVKQNPITIDAAYDVVKFGSSYGYDTALMILLSDYESTGVERKELSNEYREWLAQNAVKYGFITTEVEDAYRYVGVAHAKYMTDEELTLAEYIEYLKKNTDSTKVLTVKVDGDSYSVYYAEGKSGDSIKVPADAEYVISATNDGGVVVTVKLEK